MSDIYINERTKERFEEDWINNDGKRMIKPLSKEPEQYRARLDDIYFYVDKLLETTSYIENHDTSDDRLHQIGNYFETSHQAQLAADAIKELLKVIHDSDAIREGKYRDHNLQLAIDKARGAISHE